MKRVARLVALAVTTMLSAYVVLWAATGFDAIRSFQTAYAKQGAIMKTMNEMWALDGRERKYPRTIAGDLQEFAFGVSWLAVVLAAGWALHRAPATERRTRSTALAALATPVIVALTGLLPAETARVWIFLMPLVLLPAALEVSHWTMFERIVAYLILLGCAIAVYSNAAFILI